ncbi:MAG: glycosyltransferase [Rhodospirillales bacterium]
MSTPLVVFGEDWGGHPSSTQHLISRLMGEHGTVWVNSIGLRRPRPTLPDIVRVLKKGLSALVRNGSSLKDPAGITEPAALVSPFTIPVPRNAIERKFNRIFLGHKIRRALKVLPEEKPILWTSLPTAVDLLGCADERAVVYYCGDDFSGLAGVDHAEVAKAEERLVERADLIVTASTQLVKKFPAEKTVYLPHGVDVDLFSTPLPPPADLALDRPVAGFYGSVSDWLNVDLMQAVASALPEWRFVFIGDVHTDVSALKSLENVEFLGPRHHHELPAYVQNWSVSLLPFRDNAQIRACNPLKLREYLSAGTPIVSTNFPALNGYRDLIAVADGANDFATAISSSLKDDPACRTLRTERMKRESWDERARDLATHLSRL